MCFSTSMLRKSLKYLDILPGHLPSSGMKPKYLHIKQVPADVDIDMGPRQYLQQGYKTHIHTQNVFKMLFRQIVIAH